MKPLALFEVPAPPAPVPAPLEVVAADSLVLELDELPEPDPDPEDPVELELEPVELELEPVELELEPLELDTISPISLLIEATVPANGAYSFVPLSASSSDWTVSLSLVTDARSPSTVATTGVAALVWVSSAVW